MNENGQSEENSCCHFHPKQVVVGVCPLCLNERLLILASKSSHRLESSTQRKPPASIHKIFALGSLFNRPESQQLKSENSDLDYSSPSPEESFISIKFEENGMAYWEKNTLVSNKVSIENSKVCWNHHSSQIPNKDIKETKSVIDHGKSNNAFKWRKRVGNLFHLIQWKRSTKGGVCRVGSKVRKGWMRTLTKRRTMD